MVRGESLSVNSKSKLPKNPMHLPFVRLLTLFSHIIGCLSDFKEIFYASDEMSIADTFSCTLR